MKTETMPCLKCKSEMVPGFVPEYSHAAAILPGWHAGQHLGAGVYEEIVLDRNESQAWSRCAHRSVPLSEMWIPGILLRRQVRCAMKSPLTYQWYSNTMKSPNAVCTPNCRTAAPRIGFQVAWFIGRQICSESAVPGGGHLNAVRSSSVHNQKAGVLLHTLERSVSCRN